MLYHRQQGFIISIVTFFVLIIMLSIAISMAALVAFRQKGITGAVASSQSYYAAESGLEDALLRLNDNPQLSSFSYAMNVGSATANVTVPGVVGGARTIVSRGSNASAIREVEAVYALDSENVNFYYGVSVGAGGLTMSNNSRIIGNVFSNGNISGSGIIDNNVVVSGNGNSIQGVYVGGNVQAYSCLAPASVGNLTYVTGGSHTCTVRGATSSQSTEIAAQPLPIPQSQIDEWKSDATAGGVISGNVVITSPATMGPAKITGSLVISSTLTLTGTLYVAGNITMGNGAVVRLSSTYGSLGGVLMADGTINTGNNATFSGSGQQGSYLLILSTSTSNSAILVSNNTTGAVLYTSAGGITLSNNVSVMEATGYRVIMSNNSTVQYSSGLANIFFSSGPGGGWKVSGWAER